MQARTFKPALAVFAISSLLLQAPLVAQLPPKQEGQGEMFLKDYTTGARAFPDVFSPYREQPIAAARLDNSPRLKDLIHDGQLQLSLADAFALALENNLDIEVERYIMPTAQTDVLRARSGQAARGFQGALVPGGLNVGVLGAGVNVAAGAGGVGSAGGITGGGGAVQIGPSGTFDPGVTFNFSWDRTSAPLNTQVVAGVPFVTTYATALTSTYSQLFPTGTSYFVGLTGLRQSSTQQFLRFNPAVISRLTVGVHQPLLSGFGLLPNERFLLVARNNQKVSEDIFRLQVINMVVKVENLYWDMAAFQENIRVAEQSLAVAQKLFEDNQIQAQVGTLAQLDVVASESEVASRRRDLIVARTNLQIQETNLKNALSKSITPELDSARIVTIDVMPAVRDADIPPLETSLSSALENRPDLRQNETSLQNQEIARRFTKNNLLPNFAVFGLFAGSGLAGNTLTSKAGAGDALEQAFTGDFPERAGGFSLILPIRNRAAQADDLRAQIEHNQLQISGQRIRNQVALEVRQARVGLLQGKAQVEAARQAVVLAEQARNAEQIKLREGASTSYQEILRERDLISAQLFEVQARANYAKARVEMERAMGTVLERNGIKFVDAVTGNISSKLQPSSTLRGVEVEK